MNRHERRAAAKLIAGTLEILDPDRLVALAVADSAFAASLLRWVSSIPTLRPLCATCDAEFRVGTMPRVFHLIRRAHGLASLSGTCEACAARFPTDAALMRAVVAEYGRVTGARLRMVNPANFHTRGGRA